MRWIIKSGNLDSEVEAEDAFAACVKAVKKEGFISLGLIMSATPYGSEEFAEDGWLCSTERVLEAAGIRYELNDKGKRLMGATQSH